MTSVTNLATSLAKAIEANKELIESDQDGKRKTGSEFAAAYLKVYPNLQAIQLSTLMKEEKYGLEEIGEAMRYFLEYQDKRPFEKQIDNRRQAIVKALRVAQEYQYHE